MTNPVTPKLLQEHGYRIEYGVPDPDYPKLSGYWWTLTRAGWSGIETSEGDWGSEQEAIDDAYRHLVGERRLADPRERDAVLAGLRLLQATLANGDGDRLGDIKAIFTNSDQHEGLDLDEIDELCERINV